ncbi:branched-chain amino acid transaminase [Helicobacter sp. NHP22-001]|uniref:branched-chain amino acid transaminase n=1 Tax=Helicobacter sp. NHP22-001 TaxID=3040202 RepID=UPI00244D8ED1|nr:branched-chain amino acid transaminase [Helicobacter sp. NHP22-001]GMB96054.1 Branched-chain amino acid aminotransferase IlvE [Helicobacter sp. NHP22-001]
MNHPFIWQDGKLVPFEKATIHVLSYSLHYANLVFEGIRAYKGKDGLFVFRLHDHMQRLLDSCKAVGLKIPYSIEELNHATLETLRANKCDANTYIRPFVFMGLGTLGICASNPPIHTAIATVTWKDNQHEGIKVKTSSYRKPSVQSTMNKAKASSNYLNSQLSKQEALDCGCDEGLLLDVNGFVAEGSAESFFMVKKDKLIVPPLDYSLDSITRQTIIELAEHLNIPMVHRHVVREEIYSAQEAFFVGTGMEILPIKSLDFRPIGTDKKPITKALFDTYMRLVKGETTGDLAKFAHYVVRV